MACYNSKVQQTNMSIGSDLNSGWLFISLGTIKKIQGTNNYLIQVNKV